MDENFSLFAYYFCFLNFTNEIFSVQKAWHCQNTLPTHCGTCSISSFKTIERAPCTHQLGMRRAVQWVGNFNSTCTSFDINPFLIANENGWWVMVLYATFNNISVISWRSVLLVEETGVPRENHRPAVNHWQTLLHNVVSSTPRIQCHGNEVSPFPYIARLINLPCRTIT
jgi:hypothetical protein